MVLDKMDMVFWERLRWCWIKWPPWCFFFLFSPLYGWRLGLGITCIGFFCVFWERMWGIIFLAFFLLANAPTNPPPLLCILYSLNIYMQKKLFFFFQWLSPQTNLVTKQSKITLALHFYFYFAFLVILFKYF